MDGKKEKLPLAIFKKTVREVPAYAAFLKDSGVSPAKIKTLRDFKTIPPVTKKNYLRKYPYIDLVPRRHIPPIVSSDLGSSGEPFYWPRGIKEDERGSVSHERIFRDIFDIGTKRVLVVICFSMGTWIAGTFTFSCVRLIAKRGANISVITPGIEKEDALSILKGYAPNFDMVIMAGCPPFVMDVLTSAEASGLELAKLNLRLLLAGENFSETWRRVAHGIAGIKDSYRGSAGIYGTADAGMLGHETPLSIYLRQAAVKNEKLRADIFGEVSFLPSLVHYDPVNTYFELVGDELVFTRDGGIPLVRYNMSDTGRLLERSDTMNIAKKHGLFTEIKRLGFDRFTAPMLSLHGRKDVAVSFYALKVYPENIKAGLEDVAAAPFVTGKFIATTKMANNEKDQQFFIRVELKNGVDHTLKIKKIIEDRIVYHLRSLNKEYRKLHSSIGESALPIVELAPFGSPEFAVKRSKHRWVGQQS